MAVAELDPEFPIIEEAFWKWVNDNCPHKSPKARGTWMRDNVFTFKGENWKREMMAHKSNSGKSVVARSIVFASQNGRVISNGEWHPNRKSDAKRNWGLGRE